MTSIISFGRHVALSEINGAPSCVPRVSDCVVTCETVAALEESLRQVLRKAVHYPDLNLR